MAHLKKCYCYVCQHGVAAFNLEKNKWLKKYGWYAMMVPGDPECPHNINYHTHGLQEKFNHPDFQICFPLNEKICHAIANNYVSAVKSGTRFIPGKLYAGLVHNYKVGFIEAFESGRKVLRLLVCNPDGEVKGAAYEAQLEL